MCEIMTTVYCFLFSCLPPIPQAPWRRRKNLLLFSHCHVRLFATLWTAVSQTPVLHYLLEFAQIHVHWVGNAFQPSHSATFFTFCFQSFSSSGSFQLSWLFASDGQSIEASASASVLNVQGWFPIGLTGLTYLPFKGLVRVFSNTTIWKYQFFGTQPSLQSNSHIHTVLLEKS